MPAFQNVTHCQLTANFCCWGTELALQNKMICHQVSCKIPFTLKCHMQLFNWLYILVLARSFSTDDPLKDLYWGYKKFSLIYNLQLLWPRSLVMVKEEAGIVLDKWRGAGEEHSLHFGWSLKLPKTVMFHNCMEIWHHWLWALEYLEPSWPAMITAENTPRVRTVWLFSKCSWRKDSMSCREQERGLMVLDLD